VEADYRLDFISLISGLPIPGPNATDAERQAFVIPASDQSLITSILSAGTFFGALMAGDLADYFGRRFTVIAGCGVFIIGNILQTASRGLGLVSDCMENCNSCILLIPYRSWLDVWCPDSVSDSYPPLSSCTCLKLLLEKLEVQSYQGINNVSP